MKSVGERIKELREKSNLSQDELASLCGWQSSIRVKKYESGVKTISLEDAISFAYVLGVAPACFLSESAGDAEFIKYKSTSVPVVGSVCADKIQLNDFILSSQGALGNHNRFNSPPYRLYGIKVSTNKMNPEYSENDILIIDSKLHPLTNDLVVVKSYFNDYSLKQFVGHEDGVLELQDIFNQRGSYKQESSDISFTLGVVIGFNSYKNSSSSF